MAVDADGLAVAVELPTDDVDLGRVDAVAPECRDGVRDALADFDAVDVALEDVELEVHVLGVDDLHELVARRDVHPVVHADVRDVARARGADGDGARDVGYGDGARVDPVEPQPVGQSREPRLLLGHVGGGLLELALDARVAGHELGLPREFLPEESQFGHGLEVALL